MFTDVPVRFSDETLEQIDAAIEKVHPDLTDRQEFVEMAVEWALTNMKEQSELLMRAPMD
jgi:hypothetical protein